MLLGSTLPFFFSTCSYSYCPLESVYYIYSRYCALQLLIVKGWIKSFDSLLGGKQPFDSAAGVHTFSAAGLGVYDPF